MRFRNVIPAAGAEVAEFAIEPAGLDSDPDAAPFVEGNVTACWDKRSSSAALADAVVTLSEMHRQTISGVSRLCHAKFLSALSSIA